MMKHKGGIFIQVHLVLPKTAQGISRLKQQAAKFHAECVRKKFAALPCPLKEKAAWIDTMIKKDT